MPELCCVVFSAPIADRLLGFPVPIRFDEVAGWSSDQPIAGRESMNSTEEAAFRVFAVACEVIGGCDLIDLVRYRRMLHNLESVGGEAQEGALPGMMKRFHPKWIDSAKESPVGTIP
jgi:hypothetical protein